MMSPSDLRFQCECGRFYISRFSHNLYGERVPHFPTCYDCRERRRWLDAEEEAITWLNAHPGRKYVRNAPKLKRGHEYQSAWYKRNRERKIAQQRAYRERLKGAQA